MKTEQTLKLKHDQSAGRYIVLQNIDPQISLKEIRDEATLAVTLPSQVNNKVCITLSDSH